MNHYIVEDFMWPDKQSCLMGKGVNEDPEFFMHQQEPIEVGQLDFRKRFFCS
jgi:hypothetical protein